MIKTEHDLRGYVMRWNLKVILHEVIDKNTGMKHKNLLLHAEIQGAEV